MTNCINKSFIFSGDPLTRTKSMQPKTVHVVKNSVSRTKSSQPRLWPPQQQHQAQPQYYGFDPRMPPPAPRGPWLPETHQDLAAAAKNPGHKKVSRQYSLNPVYDSRIPGAGFGPRNDFSKPPPTFPTPHQSVAAASASSAQHHLTITRNASAPEQPAAAAGGQPGGYPLPGGGGGGTGSGGCVTSSGLYSASSATTSHTPIDLHKTMSWSSDMSGAVSPLIPSSGNVWDNANATGAKDGKDARGSLYYHLTNAGLSEDKVMRAMRDLPNETNAEVICKRIINLDKN